jgi:hypothetical protein
MFRGALLACTGSAALLLAAATAFADGGVRGPASYPDSFAERAQEAIIVFHDGKRPGEAVEDMVLKIGVDGGVHWFAWVIPFPTDPEVEPAPIGMFEELYVYARDRRNRPGVVIDNRKIYGATPPRPVDVLSRRVVGRYDVATVREREPGALNRWLLREGFQIFWFGDEVIEYYRKKSYVFVCIKVHDARGEKGKTTALHPLRFTFRTGGRDGIYFPMKMTGLQRGTFGVNLYVFYRAWLSYQDNDHGFLKRHLYLRFRDCDSYACKKGEGKLWSNPEEDPYLKPAAGKLEKVAAYFKKHHPGERFYLTNLCVNKMKPEDVRKWKNDLWLFPMYDDRRFVPHDARPGGPAEWPVEEDEEDRESK